MTLSDILGQLFIIGFHGETISASSPIVQDIRTQNLGGVILFDKFLAKNLDRNNISSESQLKNLTASLQHYAETPLFVAVDQEGGRVARLGPRHGFPATTSLAELGRSRSTALTTQHSAAIAEMLIECGINFNLAPVVDLNTYPANPIIGKLGRSFSAEPEQVTSLAEVWIRAHLAAHIPCCLKHFPGHGSSQNDSHLGFVDISDCWQECELEPYQQLIQLGLAETIMVGHLYNRKLDPEYPATLSPAIVTNLLRKQLHYDGVIITDDMQMKAITDLYSLEEAVCRALGAGIDMVIIGNNLLHDPDILSKMKTAILSAVQQGTLSEEQLRASYQRVMKLKKSYLQQVI